MATICIDGFNLALAKGSGIATYGRNLLHNLNAIDQQTQVLYGPNANVSKRAILNEIALTDAHTPPGKPWRHTVETATARFGRTAVAVRPGDEIIWPAQGGGRPPVKAFWTSPRLFHTANRAFKSYNTFTPLQFQADQDVGRPDVMHWTTTLPVKAQGAANIYTIHDLIPLRLPHTTLDNKRLFLRLCRQICRTADHVAVVSEHTRQDVIRMLGISEDRVTNTYQSVQIPKALRDRTEAQVTLELEGIFNLGWKDYFLYFGAIEPKKNLGRIVESYLASGSTRPLVVVGGRAWLEESEMALMQQARKSSKAMKKRIRAYEYLPFSLLVSLIRGARATLFPSIYEGFGLPVLESMLLDTPVLTSTAGSLPEVAGDAAVVVDPYDIHAMTRGIQALDSDDGLRDDLVIRGRDRAALFSPQRYQERLRGLYSSLGVM